MQDARGFVCDCCYSRPLTAETNAGWLAKQSLRTRAGERVWGDIVGGEAALIYQFSRVEKEGDESSSSIGGIAEIGGEIRVMSCV